MTDEKPITLKRDCAAIMIPSGERVTLTVGSTVWVTQALGGGFTLMTDHGYMVRIDGADAEVLGMTPGGFAAYGEAANPEESVEERVWSQFRPRDSGQYRRSRSDLRLPCRSARQWRPQGHGALYIDRARLRHGPVFEGRYQEKTARGSRGERGRCRLGLGPAVESKHDFPQGQASARY